MSAGDPMARWTAFLDRVAGRLDELVAEAGPGVLAVARAHPDDLLPLGNALTGLDHRVSQLRDKIDQTWDGSVRALLEAAGGPWLDRGLDAKADAELAFAHRWASAKADWTSTVARESRERAEREAARPVPCPQCGAPLALPTRRASVSVRCGACDSVCQVAATPAALAWWGSGVEALADAAALPLQLEIDRFRLSAERWRRERGWAPEPLDSLERWRALELARLRRRIEEKAALTGDPPDEAWLEARMRWFDQANLHTDQRWVRAHGR